MSFEPEMEKFDVNKEKNISSNMTQIGIVYLSWDSRQRNSKPINSKNNQAFSLS